MDHLYGCEAFHWVYVGEQVIEDNKTYDRAYQLLMNTYLTNHIFYDDVSKVTERVLRNRLTYIKGRENEIITQKMIQTAGIYVIEEAAFFLSVRSHYNILSEDPTELFINIFDGKYGSAFSLKNDLSFCQGSLFDYPL